MIVQNPPTGTNVPRVEARRAEDAIETLKRIVCRRVSDDNHAADQKSTLHLRFEEPDSEPTDLFLPSSALPLIITILTELGNGKDVTVVAKDREVTTQQAADYLNVSRPYFVKLLKEGRIPYRTVGPRRRVLVQDLVSYKTKEEADRHHGLDEIVAKAQKLGMY